MIKNIILIGFMGSGKTTVGKVLAKQLKYDFVDTDDLVELNEKTNIPKLFETKGEQYFRKSETTALRQAMGQKGRVVATGGGIVTVENNKEILDKGLVIYLQASPDQIYNNVKHTTTRPLLKQDNVYKTICTMLEDRQSLYQAAAHYTIHVDGKTPPEICRLILKEIK